MQNLTEIIFANTPRMNGSVTSRLIGFWNSLLDSKAKLDLSSCVLSVVRYQQISQSCLSDFIFNRQLTVTAASENKRSFGNFDAESGGL
jgi:hypothetical protein